MSNPIEDTIARMKSALSDAEPIDGVVYCQICSCDTDHRIGDKRIGICGSCSIDLMFSALPLIIEEMEDLQESLRMVTASWNSAVPTIQQLTTERDKLKEEVARRNAIDDQRAGVAERPKGNFGLDLSIL